MRHLKGILAIISIMFVMTSIHAEGMAAQGTDTQAPTDNNARSANHAMNNSSSSQGSNNQSMSMQQPAADANKAN